MFKSAYFKLTALYVLVVMIISVVFSVTIFNISTNELNNGLRRQTRFLQDMPQNLNPPQNLQDLEQLRSSQLESSNNNLRNNLLYLNLLILLLSSGICYYLARRTLKPVEEMFDAQNRFTADASHELRTPLTAMRTEIEVNLRDKKLTSVESRKILQSNLEEIKKLEYLSNSLLKLANYQYSDNKRFKSVSIEEIIIEAYERVEKLAEVKNIEFENKLLQTNVKADETSLVELFVVLLDNAIKYSKEHSKISITVEETTKNIEVSIKDQGIGIKASDIPYIFNRFYRADPSRSKVTTGYGIGLSIAKEVIKMHRGSIKVESQVGKGSTFIVKLPKDKHLS